MNQTEFLKQKDAAARQMREMSAKAKPTNSAENTGAAAKVQQQSKNSALFGLPIADFLKNSDTTLILGLLLILFSEDADKMLLFALIYILL